MTEASVDIWQMVTSLNHICAAASAMIAAILIAGRLEKFGAAGKAIVAGLGLTALWSLAIAWSPGGDSRQGLFEALANLAWLFAVYRLFAGDGRHASLAPIRPLVLVLAIVELLHLAVEATAAVYAPQPAAGATLLHLTTIFRLLVAIGGLVLLHNLYSGARAHVRLALRWPALALVALWGFDLNLYTIAYLASGWPAELAAFRGLAVMAMAALLTIGVVQGHEHLRFQPSRKVAFQSVSLLVIGGYFAAMMAGSQWLALAGGDFSRMLEFGFLAAALVAAAVILPSRRLRGWLKVTLVKHLFQHRYDYRAEWLRFTRTMGKGEDPASPLEERAVQAVADIADSPAGMLLAPGEHGELTLAARWKWPSAEVPATAMPVAATGFFELTGRIVDLDDLRAGKAEMGEGAVIPQWLRDDPRAWALVPLIHFERLAGVVVLARPSPVRKFDWEDFDLLRVAGQQLASYLAEHAVQAALAEASRFDDFHRRIAFVMHDIKNLASQLSLLVRNAELHADNPDFRADMLVTLRNSADKLNTLLARLSRYVSGAVDKLTEVDVAAVVRLVAEQYRDIHPVLLSECQECTVTGSRESLEQVLVHLVQNAVDASEAKAPVLLGLTSDGMHACIEVVDAGSGMSPDFVRTRLFKPFVSSKPGGFGIGAFEARELVRAMNGRLEVESREGLGSRFNIRLPLVETSGMLTSFERFGQSPGKKVA